MPRNDLCECGERTLIRDTSRTCVRVTGHDGLHQDLTGQAWETDLEILTRLRARWGHRWHIVFTGHTWIASTYRLPGTHPRVEHDGYVGHVETAPCPDRLEAQLERVPTPGMPILPHPRRPD